MAINRVDIFVSSIAELQTIAAADIHSGCLAWCVLEKQYFVLEKNSGLTANGTTIVLPLTPGPSAGNAGARWILADVFARGVPGANLQANWFIDPTNGSDSNDGATALTALKTLQEHARRLGTQTITIAMTVTLMGSTPPTDQPIYNLNFTGAGTWTFIAAASALTAFHTGSCTSITNWSGNTAAAVTDSALPTNNFWASAITPGRRIRTTSGISIGAVAWPIKDLGTKQGRVSNWLLLPTPPYNPTFLMGNININVGNTYVIEDLPSIDNIVFNVSYPNTGGFTPLIVFQSIWFKNHHFEATNSNQDGAAFIGCDMGTQVSPVGGWALIDCRLPTGFFIDARSELDVYAGCCLGDMEFGAGLANVDLGFTIQGGRAQFFGGEGIIAQLGVYDSATFGIEFFSEAGWTVEAFFATTKLWGSGNGTYGVRVHNSSIIPFDTFAGCTITGTTEDIGLGPVAGIVNKAWGAAPVGICDLTTGVFTTMAGVIKL